MMNLYVFPCITTYWNCHFNDKKIFLEIPWKCLLHTETYIGNTFSGACIRINDGNSIFHCIQNCFLCQLFMSINEQYVKLLTTFCIYLFDQDSNRKGSKHKMHFLCYYFSPSAVDVFFNCTQEEGKGMKHLLHHTLVLWTYFSLHLELVNMHFCPFLKNNFLLFDTVLIPASLVFDQMSFW